MYEVEFEADAVAAALKRLAAGVADMTPVMQSIGEYLMVSTKDRFPTGQAPDGSAWQPKSPTTLARYGARKSNRVDHRPLYGPTGLLSSQIHYQAGHDFAEVGSNRIYAAVMQFGAAKGAFGNMANGSPIPWGDIPARPYLGLSAKDATEIPAIIAEWLETVARA